jgi:hypothetical protein
LHTNRRIDPTTKRGRNAARVQTQRLEQLTELLSQLDARSFFGDNDTGPDTGQVDVALFQRLNGIAQRLGAQFDDTVGAEGVAHTVLGQCAQPQTGIGFDLSSEKARNLIMMKIFEKKTLTNLIRSDQYRMVATVDADQCPHGKS